MKRKKLLVISILLLLTFNILAALNLGTIPASAADYPSVYVDPESTIDPGLTPGDNYTVSIMTDYTGSDITSYQFTLSYNPTVLNGIDLANGDIIGPPAFYFFEPGDFDNTAGKLSLTGAFYFGEDVAPGPGTLATVTFEVAGTGESNITLGIETQLIGWDGVGVYYIVNGITMPTHIGHGYFSNAPPAVEYELTINTVGNGSVTKNPDQATYADGTNVTLTAVPDAGWTFDSWSGDLTGSDNPDTVTMDGNKTVTATFTEIPVVTYELTINTVGNGSVTKNPDQATYADGTNVTLTAVPDAGWTFDSWSGDLTGSDNPDTVTMDGNKTVTATFTEIPVETTIDTIIMLVEDFYNQGAIDEAGIKESLLDKLYAADKMMDRGKTKTAKNILKALINQLKAQSGKHVREAEALILIADAEQVINNL